MKLNQILEQTIPGLGYELVDVEISPAKLVRVFIDKLDGSGVTIADCEMVSNHLSKLFLVEEVDYNRLEISSPGLERPLKKIEDFIKYIGRYAKIKTNIAIGDQKVFYGNIQNVDGSVITLSADEQTVLTFNYAEISKARLAFDDRSKNKVKPNAKNKK